MNDEGHEMREKQMARFEKLLTEYETTIDTLGRTDSTTKTRRRRLVAFVAGLIED
jgi:hypothetical protein